MVNRSSISLYKYIYRHPLRPSPKPTTSIPLKPQSNSVPKSLSQLNPVPKSLSNFPHFLPIPNPHFNLSQNVRHLSADTDKIVDEINLKFAEAREEIEMALESKETVYFNEEAECARVAVKEVLDMFQGLLDKLPENEKGALRRSMGLKIEQLKAELAQLEE